VARLLRERDLEVEVRTSEPQPHSHAEAEWAVYVNNARQNPETNAAQDLKAHAKFI